MIRTILFDLDGTLLPMDQDKFTTVYFGKLSESMAQLHEPEALISAVWKGTRAMLKNDGRKTNEAVFWDYYSGVFGPAAREEEPLFADFYERRFRELRPLCGMDPAVGPLTAALADAGYTLAAATNPVFPMTAQQQRLSWTGADPKAFSRITSYENSRFCKPNPAFYTEVLAHLNASPEETLMVGNDVKEDMDAAKKAGINGFLITACLLNPENKDISAYPHGNFADLKRYIADNGFRTLAD
jgi:FMN phosphatase YigB (HAD superfamily)